MTITAKTRIALSKETAWGAPGSFFLLPVQPPAMAQNYEQIVDDGLRGIPAKDFGVYRGAGATEATLEGIFYPEELGYLLYGIMGSVASVPGTPSIHTFMLGENPPSFTIEDYPKLQAPGGSIEEIAYQYRGCLISSLVLRFNAGEGAVGFTATLVGKNSGTVAPSAVTGTPSPPFLGWQGSVDLGDRGGQLSHYAQLINAEWTFSRETILQHTLNNTQEPMFGYSGPLEVTCTASVKFHSDADIARYREDRHMHIKFTFVNKDKKLIIEATDMFFNAPPEIDRGAIDVKANWDLRACYDPEAVTPVKVILHNSQQSYL